MEGIPGSPGTRSTASVCGSDLGMKILTATRDLPSWSAPIMIGQPTYGVHYGRVSDAWCTNGIMWWRRRSLRKDFRPARAALLTSRSASCRWYCFAARMLSPRSSIRENSAAMNGITVITPNCCEFRSSLVDELLSTSPKHAASPMAPVSAPGTEIGRLGYVGDRPSTVSMSPNDPAQSRSPEAQCSRGCSAAPGGT